LLLTSLTPPNCHLVIGNNDAQIFSGLGFDNKAGRKRIVNRRYILKQERDNNYYKFRSRCVSLDLDCPENDIWVEDLKKANESGDFVNFSPEPKQKTAVGVRDLGSLSPEPKKMPPTRSCSLLTNGGDRDYKNYDEPGKSITRLYFQRFKSNLFTDT
jgi:hypothetical protein